MRERKKQAFSSQFETDVYKGLTSSPKTLNSKYFYDKEGDELFQKIMEMPEYYLTDLEYDILEQNKEEIADIFAGKKGFDLIELGAGDGKKTKILLRHLLKTETEFEYFPVDISENVLQQLTSSLEKELPGLKVSPQQGTYTEVLEYLDQYKNRKKVILFLGSNLGNMLPRQAADFLKKIKSSMSSEDLLFLGLDQKKHPQKILDAYNDPTGITEAFNKNLLHRINRQLEANFIPDDFLHWPMYNPESGTTKSYLVSSKDQQVHIKSLGLTVDFRAWESIHTEISQKYDEASVSLLARESGMRIAGSFADENQHFRNYIFKKNKL